jgi:hypothetical protein
LPSPQWNDYTEHQGTIKDAEIIGLNRAEKGAFMKFCGVG